MHKFQRDFVSIVFLDVYKKKGGEKCLCSKTSGRSQELWSRFTTTGVREKNAEACCSRCSPRTGSSARTAAGRCRSLRCRPTSGPRASGSTSAAVVVVASLWLRRHQHTPRASQKPRTDSPFGAFPIRKNPNVIRKNPRQSNFSCCFAVSQASLNNDFAVCAKYGLSTITPITFP